MPSAMTRTDVALAITAGLLVAAGCRQQEPQASAPTPPVETTASAELAAPVIPGPSGKGVMHAMLRVGNSAIMMADAWPGAWEQGPDGSATAGLFLYVDDCDALFDRAIAAGCDVIFPVNDMFGQEATAITSGRVAG